MIEPNKIKAREIAERECNPQRAREITQYESGWVHQKYKVSFTHGDDIVVRFPAERKNVHFNNDYSFDTEIAVTRLLQEKNIPVPRILNQGNYEGVDYLVMEHLDGPNLFDAQARDSATYGSEALKAIMKEWGSAMAQVHTITQQGFGYVGQKPQFVSWEGMFEDFLRSKLRSELIPAELRDAAGRFFAQERGLIEQGSSPISTLCLYDLHGGNILVKDGKLLGLLDFECAVYGHKSLDFTLLDRKIGDVEIEAPFLEGYTANGGKSPENLWRFKRLNTMNFLMSTILNYHGATGKRANVSADYTKKLEVFLQQNA